MGKKVHMDLISLLPDDIIHRILSCLPIKEAVRTSILSKSWNKVCRSYNFLDYLHLDHNKFALQKLKHVEIDGREPDIHEIRNDFIKFVTKELLYLSKQNSPVLELVLDVAVIDDEYDCVDRLLELVMQSKVDELCVSVQTRDSRWDDEIAEQDACYDFPYDVLPTSRRLQSLKVHGCMFARVLNYDLGAFSSLRSLLLSQVFVPDETVLTNLASCCPEIELIEFNSCTLWMHSLDLSIFPKLKKASIVGVQHGENEVIDLCNTNLESFYCDNMECMLGEIDCRDKIRELTLHDFYYRFNDFTADFPLAVNAELMIDDVQEMVNRFEARGNCLETLDLSMSPFLVRMFVNCENLKQFNYKGCGFIDVYIICPNLERFNYLANEPSDLHDYLEPYYDLTTADLLMPPFPKVLRVFCDKLKYFNYEGCGFEKVDIICSNLRQFNYVAKKLPDKLDLILPPDIGCINFRIDVSDNLDTSWFLRLWNFQEEILEGHEICLHLRIHSHMAEFVPDELAKQSAAFKQKKIQLIVELQCTDMQNPTALVDGLVWSIHPTTFTIRGHCCSFVKALYDKLDSITQHNRCCGYLKVCYEFWWHNLVNGYFKNVIEDVKKKLLTSVVEMNESSAMELCLNFLGLPNM